MLNEDPYLVFLRGKIEVAPCLGFDVDPEEINPILKPHQRDIVRWAVRGGRRALFEAFGLGKSLQQIEILRLVKSRACGRVLVVCPLGVRQEFKRDGKMVGVDFKFVRRAEEMEDSDSGFYLTNYESIRDGKLDPNLFTAVSLDEASVLRSFGSMTYQSFLTLFKDVPFRFVATATPSPNRYKELIHYAGFLGIMDTGQALTRFFQRDSTQANNLTLYPHMEREFWLWLHSWAIFLQKPSDLGYSDEGYDLPELNVIWHEIPVDHSQVEADRDGQVPLFQDQALGLKQAAEAKRKSLHDRVEKMREILDDDPDSHYILWHDLEAERHAIKAAVPNASEVFGSLDLDVREQRVIDFSEGRLKYLATKPEISGSGCNFQRHCHKAIFLGVGYKFNDFIQSIHRIYRFLQTQACEIHIIYSEAEREVRQVLEEKWGNHKRMVENMSEVIKSQGLAEMDLSQILERTLGIERIEVMGQNYTIANNDCVIEARRQPENHAGLIVTSIPFANHYEYTPSFNDFGHTRNNDHFWNQMDFLTPELLRILKPGRLYCCHVKDRILFGNVTGAGAPTVSPFHAEAIFHAQKHGFDYMGMITVVTDVVRENNQTYRLGWSEQCKDGTKMGVGSPEYVLLFRKPQTDRSKGYADDPVKKSKSEYTRAQWQIDAHAFWRSSGNRFLTATELEGYDAAEMVKLFTDMSLHRIYDYQQHVQIGEHLEAIGSLPATFMSIAPGSHDENVWHDVNRMRTLNGNQTQKGLANHVCPLQFDIVDRLITRYSNPGDLVYDPFGGLMTVPFRALKLGRRGQASELNAQYFLDGSNYMKAAEVDLAMPTLFDVDRFGDDAA
jgi:DNA modification methylase